MKRKLQATYMWLLKRLQNKYPEKKIKKMKFFEKIKKKKKTQGKIEIERKLRMGWPSCTGNEKTTGQTINTRMLHKTEK